MSKTALRTRVAPTMAIAAALALIGGGVATAEENSSLGSSGTPAATPLTFDGWSSCPVEDLDVATCATVVVRGGSMKIGGLTVPVPDGGLKIAGGVKYATQPDGSFVETFVPKPDGRNGVYSNPISVPGGAIGIDTPLNLTQITATVEAVGLPNIKVLDQELTMPVRLKLSNSLLGNNCYLGSTANPINLHLTTTGNPPSEPIGDYPGAVFPAVQHTDNLFAAPAASGCGVFGALNWAVNLRAGTPSARERTLSPHPATSTPSPRARCDHRQLPLRRQPNLQLWRRWEPPGKDQTRLNFFRLTVHPKSIRQKGTSHVITHNAR